MTMDEIRKMFDDLDRAYYAERCDSYQAARAAFLRAVEGIVRERDRAESALAAMRAEARSFYVKLGRIESSLDVGDFCLHCSTALRERLASPPPRRDEHGDGDGSRRERPSRVRTHHGGPWSAPAPL